MHQYWINDGIYYSINCVLNKHTIVIASPLACVLNPTNPICEGERVFPLTVYCLACDLLHTIFKDYSLSELEVNDWLVSPYVCAYTVSRGSKFNGFDVTIVNTFLVNFYNVVLCGRCGLFSLLYQLKISPIL